MKFEKRVIFILAIGVLSSVAVIYFYMLQRNFTNHHREFLIAVNRLENSHAKLKHLILQNSIYSYYNQDQISNTIRKIGQEYIVLKDSYILKDGKYMKIKTELEVLKSHIDDNLRNIENYIMLNAGIKNSLVFLSKHIENPIYLKKENKDLFVEATKIIKRYYDVKRMQDIDYIYNRNILLESDSKDKKLQRLIKYFNMHSMFLLEKFPLFIKTTKKVLDNDVDIQIEKLKNDFSTIALNDFKALDIFASFLFAIFLVSLAFITILFIKYMKENKKLQSTTASLKHSLEYDHLTDLRNRQAFENMLSSVKSPHLLLINIDGFKYINDIYGNEVGDSLLKQLAGVIKDGLSGIDYVSIYRLNGDEFGILFDGIQRYEAFEIATRLEQFIANHSFHIDDLTLHVVVSIASNSTPPILENTDLALKLLKQSHTKRVLEYHENLNLKADVQENLKIIEQIKSAIEDDRIVPFFQPIVNLKTMEIEKYEALVRLKLKNGEFLPPFKFLDISKRSSYYHYITKAMIEKTLSMAKEFPGYRFSINISMIDILDVKLIDILFDALDSNPKEASRLDVELLESENLQNIQEVQKFIARLHRFGSKVLIDDFGTGYSNFSYFADLDVDIIKIDGSIVSEIGFDKKKLHMLKSIHKFSSGMNMKNIAEFVESVEVVRILQEMGIDYAQGYYFSEPLPRPLERKYIL